MFPLRVFSSNSFYIYLTFEFQMFFYSTYIGFLIFRLHESSRILWQFVNKFICAIFVSFSHLLKAMKRFGPFLERNIACFLHGAFEDKEKGNVCRIRRASLRFLTLLMAPTYV